MENKERKCIACGEILGESEKYCGNCGTVAPAGPALQTETESLHITTNVEYNFTWKWHKVYCNFIIILQSIFIFLGGLNNITTGLTFTKYSGYVPGWLIPFAVVTGLVCIITAALGFVARSMLKSSHSFAIKMLLIYTGLTVAIPLVNSSVTLAEGAGTVFDVIKAIIVPGALMFGNMVYYLKRVAAYEE